MAMPPVGKRSSCEISGGQFESDTRGSGSYSYAEDRPSTKRTMNGRNNAGSGGQPHRFGMSGGRLSLPYRLLLPSHSVGYLIGRSGASIRDIESQSGATVQFQKEHESHGSIADKVVSITGPSDAKRRALGQMLEKLKGVTKLQDMDGKEAIVVVVPNKSVSLIIGSRGQQIQDLSQQSGCDFQVHGEQVYGPNERAVSVRSGQVESLIGGVDKIYELLEGFIESGKLTEMDFVPTSQSKQPQGHPGAYSLQAGLGSDRGGHYGGGGSYGMQQQMQPQVATLSVNPCPQSMGRNGGMNSGDAGGRNYSYAGRNGSLSATNLLHHSLGNQMTKCIIKFVVTSETAAWVVGKGGCHIKDLRSHTGCEVDVVDCPSGTPDGFFTENDRLVCISGSITNKYNAMKQLIVPMEQRHSNVDKTFRMLVPSTAVSYLIGARGQTVNLITRQSNADVQIDKHDAVDGEKLLNIQGAPEAKLVASILVLQKLEEVENPELMNSDLCVPIPDVSNMGTTLNPPPVVLGLHSPGLDDPRMSCSVPGGAGLLPAPHQSQPSMSNGRGRQDHEALPESQFLYQAQQHTTPRVIATSQQYVLEVYFPKAHADMLSRGSDTGRSALSSIMERSGCLIRMGVDCHSGFSRSLILSGTPVANCIALLLIQEKLMDLDNY